MARGGNEIEGYRWANGDIDVVDGVYEDGPTDHWFPDHFWKIDFVVTEVRNQHKRLRLGTLDE